MPLPTIKRPRFPEWFSQRSYWLAPFLVLSLLLSLLWAGVGWFSLSYGDMLVRDTQQDLRDLAVKSAQEVDESLISAAGLLRSANLLLMERDASPLSIKRATALIERARAQNRYGVTAVLLSDQEGHVYSLSAWQGEPVAQLKITELLKTLDGEGRGTSKAGPPLSWMPSEGGVMPVAMKLDRPFGKLQWAVALIELKPLTARLHKPVDALQAALALVRMDGLLIFRVPDTADVGHVHFRMPTAEQAPRFGSNGMLKLSAERMLDHQARIGGYSRLQYDNSVFFATRITSEVLQTFHRDRLILLSLSAAASLIAVFLTQLFIKKHRQSLLHGASLTATGDAVPLGLFRSNSEGEIIYANATYLHIFELDDGDSHWGWLNRIPADQARVLRQRWLRRSKSQDPLDTVITMQKADGSTRLLSVRTAPVIVGGQVIGHAGAIEDITVRSAQQASAQTLASIMEMAPDYICQFDPQGHTRYINPALRKKLQLSDDFPAANMGYSDIFDLEAQTPYQGPFNIEGALVHGFSRSRHLVKLGRGAEEFHADVSVLVHRDAQANPTTISIIVRDISIEVRAEQERTHHQTMLNAIAQTSTALIAVVDTKRRFTFVNQALQRVLSLRSDDFLGRHIDDVLEPDDGERGRALDRALQGEASTIERHLPTPQATVILDVRFEPMYQENGEIEGVICIGHDVTEHREEAQRLTEAAQTDPLTGLLNRNGFAEQAGKQFARANEHDHLIAILYIDLDRFKPINDEFGHAAGDSLLIAVSRRLRRALRPQDVLARFGGDEFAVLLPELKSAHDATKVAAKLVRAVSTPFMVGKISMQVGLSVGFSVNRGTRAKLDQMVLEADAKLYEAKRAGRDCFRGAVPEDL